MNPKVRIIARTVLDPSGVEEFLGDSGTAWRIDPQAASPEKVVEFAGLVCYM